MDSRTPQTTLFWEQFHRSPLVKAVAIVLIVVLTWVFTGKEFSLSRAISDLNYDSQPAKAKKPTKPAEKLHAAVLELQGLLAIQAKRDLSDRQVRSATAARGEISTQLRALDLQFTLDRVKLWKLDAKDALKRLSVIEAKTAKLKKQLATSLANVPSDGAKATLAANSATKTLTALSPEKPQQPLSSDLSFGIKNAKPRPVSLSAGITPAYNSPTPNETASPLPREPQPEDLAETPETRVTPAITQLATTLNHDPVKIYEYVRNNIRIETYYGIRKGADQTLAEKAGSDADQAALLIALLRASGIHARFVQGVAELSAAKAANWLGVDVAHGERIGAVPDILWSGGKPVNTTKVNGQLTKIRFNHIWAEAYVAQEAYRGVDEGSTQKSWSPLDASIKENVFKQPQADFKQLLEPAVTNWAQGFVDGSQTVGNDGIIAPPPAQTAQQTQTLLTEAQSVLEDNGIGDNSTLSDVIGSHEIRQANLTLLPNTTPFKALSIDGELRTMPDNFNASVSFAVSGSDPLSVPDPEQGDQGGFSFTAKTLDLANKRITVSYVPATENDAEIVDAYHGLLNAPSYAAALIPVLRVDGQVVARGHQAVSTGYTQNFRITYRMPGFAADVVENPVYVGSLSAVSLDLGAASGPGMVARANQMTANAATVNSANALTDARAGEALSLMGSAYFARNDLYNHMLADVSTVANQRQVSGAIVATNVNVSYVSQMPVVTSLAGVSMDVDQDSQSVVGATSESEATSTYVRTSGLNASASEGLVFENVFQEEALSTAKVFEAAAKNGVAMFQLTESNIAAVLPQLQYSDAVKQEITETVESRGATVVIPQNPVVINGMQGIGYAAYLGDSADYRVVGGASGSILDLILLDPVAWAEFLGAPDWLAPILQQPSPHRSESDPRT